MKRAAMGPAMIYLLMVGIFSPAIVECVMFGTSGTALHRNDDGYSSAQSIANFPFFGRVQTRLYVCTNGIISFGSGVSSFTPTPFPIASNPVVAPFWGDVNTNSGGDIYYRTASAGDRAALTAAIGIAGFVATSGYIVSWVNVAAYGGGGPRNTFQAALATDGTSSFVIFNYQSISWTFGSASRGIPAQAGFDAGDRTNSYAHEWSRTSNINRLPSSSNVGVTGRYIYGVGAPVIVPVDEVVVDPCADVNCQNGGTCNDGNCNCRTGYEGSRCESVINWCSRNGINCNNHGTCSNRADNTGWQCSCRHAGYSGTQCEVVRDWCSYSNINCYGRGTCSNTNDNDNWQCACIHNGYYGSQCENIRDWCSDQGQSCSSHGTCSNNPNNDWWVCSCRHSGYYGTECEHIVDWCTTENEDCNGNGVCSNEPDNAHWVCACYEGFRDTDCDDQLCLGGIYCHNNGVCGPEGCQCVSPYAGDDCQTVNPACTGVDCGYGSCTGNGQCSCFSGYAQLSSTSPCTGQLCGGRVCYNGGSCVDGACVCAVGWLGDTCQEEDLCHGATCNSHGECVVYNGAPVCRCDDLSFGPESGPIEDQCSQQTCSNGHVCHNGGLCNANGGCDCVYPYNGASCTGTDYCSGIDCGYGTCSQAGQGFECTCSSTDVWVDPYSGLCTTTVCAGNQLFCRNTATCQSGPTCSCPGGYSGDNCEVWDACYEVTCLNGATCRDNQHNGGDYLCDCADGYHGRHCELQRCTDQVTCYNGGQCSDTGCICPVEWTGPSCQESVPSFCQHYYCGVGGTCTGDSSPVCVCESGYQQSAPSEPCNLVCADLNCQNGGVCDATAPVCQCPPGYYGETCGLTSPCGAVECHHARGSCGDYQGDLASCQCVLPIYTGDDCSTEICSSGPQSQCQNGGSCTSSGCECPYPYEGSQCQTLNYCPSGNCAHGTCQSGGDGAVCTCDDNYIQDETTGRCTTEYLCVDGVHFCMHNGECNAAGDGCNCVDGYTGRNCEEIDLCEGVDCNNGFCIIQPETVPDIPYICSCDEGWVGGHCDIRRCTNSLICQNGAVCSEDGCTCTPGWTGDDCTIPLDPACYTATENRDCGHGSCGTGGVCNCDSGWIRDPSGSCTTQSCGGVQCQNGATCLDNQCDCPPNYLGDDCSNAACLNIDCGANGFCQLMNDGSNECICVDLRWSGEYCQNELCSDGSTCQHGGSCVAGASPCACTTGFSGTHCENVDHCAGVVCSHGTCVVDNNAAFCRCDTGYVIDPISGLCTQQLCTDGNQFCLNDQPCSGPSSCACSPPYSGTNCEIVDYCYENTCNDHGECRLAVDHAGNSLHRHECVCEDGYHGSDCQYEFCVDNIVCFNGGTCRSTGCECTAEWQGPSCEVPMPPACSQQCDNGECDSSGTCVCYEGYSVGPTGICDANTPQEGVCQGTTCYNGGTCTEVENLLTSDIEPVCVCSAGWTGDDCGTYDACSLYDCSGNGECVMYQDTTPRCVCFHERWRDSTGGTLDCDLEGCSDGTFCQNGGSCLAGGGCACPYPYEGNECEIENVCPSQQCRHGFCTPGTGDFAWDCDCYPGYIYNEITGYCDIMLCADHVEFCQNGGTCVDDATTSTCTCPAGISGDNCEIVDHCHNIDCHSGNCENLPTDYQCNCLQGFSGTHCELQDCLGDLTCFNDGICGQDGCICTDLWEGPTCEQRRTNPCEGVDCGNGQCLQAGSGYECQCETGFSQDSPSSPCYAAVCTTTICQNGGTCLPPAGNDPERCQCMPGYLGDTCEIITCAHVNCHDHGVCVVLPNGAGQCVCDHSRWSHTDGPDATPGDCALEVLNGVTCQNGGSCIDFCTASPPCECPWPFVGANCETSSPCDPSLDTCVHGTCYAEARDGRDFWCYCDDGYIPDSDSGFCVTELCDVSFCQHGGTCNADQLSCTCPPGISGDHCEIVDHCYGHDCSGNGYCEVLNGDEYHCYCNDGWIGTDCELQRCIDGVTCFNGGSCRTDFGCECLPGFGGDSCENVYTDACANLPCVHGECDDSSGSATCVCHESWSGADCNSHDCSDGTLSCQNGGTCYDATGGVTDSLFPENSCVCVEPWGDARCSSVDPCAGEDCNLHGDCLQSTGTCTCHDARWTGDHCEIETTTVTCLNGGSANLAGDGCNCPFPYHGDSCEHTDWCLNNPCVNGFCAVNNANTGFECDCYDGFIMDINDVCVTQLCTVSDRFCLNGGTCVDWDTYSTCTCPPGVTGENCETVDHCFNVDCNGHGLCQNLVDGDGHVCECFDDWQGQDCSQQDCLGETCWHNGVCGASGCRCPPEWTGPTCEEHMNPDCQNVDCGPHGTCVPTQDACTISNDGIIADSATFNPGTDDLNQYATHGFGGLKVITEFTTSGGNDRWVTSFTAEITTDGSTWVPIRDTVDHSHKLFLSNDGSTTHTLDYPLIASQIRLNPRSWWMGISMTGQVNGCDYAQTGTCQCDEGYSSSTSGGYCDTQDTCVDIGACQNGGTCVNGQCLCDIGYTGFNCESSLCHENNVDCYGHGRCEIQHNNEPVCVCDHSRFSHSAGAPAAGDCSVETCGHPDATTGLACHNGGSCVSDNYLNTAFHCECVYPYTGETCEVYELCNIDPCVHGTCYVDPVFGTDSHCLCDAPYIRDPDTQLCTTEQCSDGLAFCYIGGSCNAAGTGCDCEPEYSGDHCENQNYCYENDCSGHGVCHEVAAGTTDDTMTDYVCDCEWGWIGRDCELQRCLEGVTCFNGGTCNSIEGCICPDGFGGESCEIVYSPGCTSIDCHNHAYCDDVNYESATCVCETDYTGADCNTHVCDGGARNCYNGGTCMDGEGDVSTSLYPDSRCLCIPPYGGDDCSTIVDDCAGATCSNHGQCLLFNNVSSCMCDHERWTGENCEIEACTEGINCNNGGSCQSDNSCLCPFPYHGDNCENMDWCLDNPCDEGECVTNADNTGYVCTCAPDFIHGQLGICDTALCADRHTFCMNGGTCEDHPTDSVCLCPPGVSGTNCETVDYCFNQDCNEHGFCENLPHIGTFQCICFEGWLGQTCDQQRCMDLTCMNNGVCGPEGCRCTDSWAGPSCEERVDLDCQGMDCGPGTCVDSTTDVYPVCDSVNSLVSGEGATASTYHDEGLRPAMAVFSSAASWSSRTNDHYQWLQFDLGHRSLITAIKTKGRGNYAQWVRSYYVSYSMDGSDWLYVRDYPVDKHVFAANTDQNTEVSHNIDLPVIAQYVRIHPQSWRGHISMRVDVMGCAFTPSGTCDCDEGYSSSGDPDYCGIQDECLETGACLNGGSCYHGQCQCAPGYTGHNCEVSLCVDNEVDCHQHGDCQVLSDGEPHCICRHSRYQHSEGAPAAGDCANEVCGHPNNPTGLVCQNGGSCIADDYLNTQFHCACPYPYTGDSCETYLLCSDNPCVHGNCIHDGIFNTESTCLCDSPYTIDPDTQLCTRHECADGRAFCLNGGTCNSAGTGCDCPAGTSGDSCENVDYCHEIDCNGHGTCHEVATGNTWDTATGFYCDCVEGWTGEQCGEMFCIDGNTCENGGECSTYGCECPPGFGGPSCEYVYSSDCTEHSCEYGYCDDVNFAEPTCVCDTGYSGEDCNAHVCDDGARTCYNGGTCVDDYGSATTHLFTESRCYCVEPWGGDDCSETDPCNGVTCSQHGECRIESENAMCVCDDNRWTGDNCELEACVDGITCQNGGSCVDGGCACPYPHHGDNCEYTDYCIDNHCMHGECYVSSEECLATSNFDVPLNLNSDDESDNYYEGTFEAPTRVVTGEINSAIEYTMSFSMDGNLWNFVRNYRYEKTVISGQHTFAEQFTMMYIRIHVPLGQPAAATYSSTGCQAMQTGATCDCAEHYYLGITGVCDRERCADESNFCINGGTCIQESAMSTYCSCPPGITGEHCETVDHCYNQDCNDHGQCENDIRGGTYQCTCFDGWSGQDCSINYCLFYDITCMNNGVCGAEGCRCPPEFTGVTCETRVDQDCLGIQCGHGHCVNAVPDQCDSQGVLSGSMVDSDGNSVSGTWMPTLMTGDYLQFDFSSGGDHLLEGIRSSGSSSGRIMTYHVSYKRGTDGEWQYLRNSHDSTYKLFENNREDHVSAETTLDNVILATHIRIHPQTWIGTVNFDFELLGCSFDQTGVCECDAGYSSLGGDNDFCNIRDSCSETGMCSNGGTCVDGDCLCLPGFSGHNCEEASCASLGVDCHDHGDCVIRNDGSAMCICHQTRYEHSESAPAEGDCANERCPVGLVCQNGGSCIPSTYEAPTNDYTCSCVYPWTGSQCELNDICNINPCVNGNCHVDLVFGTESHCECNDGYVLNPDTQICTTEMCDDGDVNHFCMNGGTCHTGDGGCDCPPGVSGERCEDVDYCFENTCSGHGTCYEIPTGETHDTNTDYLCQCEWGWMGEDCELAHCLNDQTCFNGGTCTTHGCDCAEGYGGETCELVYEDECVALQQEIGWLTQDWPVHGYCDGTASPVTVVCDTDYTGGDCNTHVCDDGARQCQHGGTCVDDYGTPTDNLIIASRCYCVPPYGGDDCSQLQDPCSTENCSMHGECIVNDAGDAAECVCLDARWTGDRCQNEACAADNNVCQNGGSCMSDGSCSCAHPYHGDNCELVDFCLDNRCLHGECDVIAQECSTTTSGFVTSSADGSGDFYVLEMTTPHTVTAIEVTSSSAISFTVSYSMDNSVYNFIRSARYLKTQFNGGRTELAEPITAQYVRVHIDTNTALNSAELHGCVAQQTGFECDCAEGYMTGVSGQCDTDLCDDGYTFCLNSGYCVDAATTSTCVCPPATTGTNCEFVDHCATQSCNGHGQCENYVDHSGYVCHCMEGFLGQDCSMERCLDLGTTCMHAGICGPEGCRCTQEWTGPTCEEPVHVDCQLVQCGEGTCIPPTNASPVEGCDATSSGIVSDAGTTLSASSEHSAGLVATNAVLNSAAAWAAATNNEAQWVKATFANTQVISAVSIQGRAGVQQWVTYYTVSYGLTDGETQWIRSFVDSRERMFDGNTDAVSVVTSELERPIIADWVAIHPQRWHSHISMRFSLTGCQWQQAGTCDCPDPYVTDVTGSCEVETCDEGFNCENGGTCYMAYDGEMACNCRPGFNGRDCSESICEGVDCHDHGRCIILSTGEASCVCDHSRWTHDDSQGQDGFCALEECGNGLTCQNGGSCLPRPTDATTVCVCPYPYTGAECETYELCNVNPCVHGACFVDLVYGTDSHCLCDEPYTHDPDTQLCTTERCTYNNAFCMNGGSCNDDGTACDCPEGITGEHCENIDYCHDRHNCSGHGRCVEVQTGGTWDTPTDYSCLCNEGWQGRECNQQRCNDDITCMNGGECGFDGCNCQPGWGGLSCEIPLAPECYEPQVYNCSHGYCVVQDNGELGCECYEGYSVDTTDTPVRCNVHTDGELSCQHGGTVGMVDGEARCMCTDDYIGDNCETRSACADFECAANARCILDENNNPSCACAHSRWSGLLCEIVTCNDNSVCQNGGSCVNNDDESYSCNCPYPYTGARCEVEDYCQDLEQACGHAIRCHPGVVTECDDSRRLYYVPDSELTSSLAGSGPENSRLDGDGVWTGAPGEYIQVDLGEVMAVKGVITQGSGGDYVSAFTFSVSRDTRHYEDATMTAQSATATQNMLDTPLIGRYVRLLVTGMVSQPHLQWDVLACPYDDFQCECNFDPNEVTGHYTDLVTGRCTTATCASGDWFCLNDGECMDNDDGSAWCHCPQGTTGEHCETSDLCHQVECSNNGWCESRPHLGDHVCHCNEGWMGAECEMQLCTEGVTCMNGGVCWPLQGCVCPPEFSGPSCEDPIPLRCQGAPETEHGTCIPDEDDWTTTTTGCSCWFDESRTDCACCTAGGCVCDESQPYRCVACGDTEACDLPMEIDVFEHDTWQSSTDGDGDSSYAVDGSSPDQDDSDTSTCVQTLYGSEDFRNYRDWFTVDLDGAYRVYYIKIHGVPDQSMSPFTVYLLGDNENPREAEESLTCKFVDSPLAYNSEGATVMCDSPVVGRFLTIDSASDSTPLSFCDIEVFGERPFTIECEHGYTNQDFARHASCDMQICDYATNRTCENGGSCLANNTCACPIGFQGEFCQYAGCDGVFCYDHGRCEMLWNEMPECVCNHDRWSHDDNLATNAPGVGNCALETCESGLVCYNGGSCVSGAEGGDECSCTYHWTGATCEEPVPCPEAENTCIHGMGCAESTATGHLSTDFTCECDNDYIVNPTTGECTTRICDDGFGGEHMCMHLGTCVMLEDGTQGCECPPGIFGANCEHIDHCHEQACGGHGLCMNFTNRYYCACDDGWIGDDCNMQRCDDRYTCFHGARCQADGWNQGCICPENRFDLMCESFDWCLDVDCGPGGTCQVMDGVDGYNYVCNCAQDWRQEENDRSTPCDNEIIHCSVPDWVEHGADFLDYCQFGGECTPHSMFYEYEAFYVNYTADPTYEGDLEGVWIQPENRTVANMSCTCGPDRLGIQCEILNECHFENCSHHGTCNPNDDGTFNCTCDPRYEGEHCSSHVCSDGVNRCHNGGTCSRNGQCTCVYPYTGDSCEETDWCTFAPGWEMDCYHGYCSSREDGFLCVCDNGYIHSQDTGECTTELCNDNEDTFCMNQGTCNDENSNCTCHEEWIDHNCETYNWCWNQTCTLRGDCINFEFDYNCSCFPGFYGRDCELQACYDGVTCRNNSLCSSDGCQCAPGYGGVECDVMMPCEGVDCGYGRCVENITLEFPRQEPIYHTASYYCEIPNNLVNRWAQAPGGPQAPFNVRICAGGDFFCYNEGQCQGDSCLCQDGFYGDDCSVSDPCMPDPCFGHGTCHVNDDATFNCTCAENFQDEDCSVNFCPLTNVLCMNGGTCPHDEFSDQRCWCPFPYTGPTCEEIDYCVDVDCAQGTCDPLNGTCVCQEGWIRDYHTGRCTTSMCNRSNMFCMNNGTCTEGEYTCECHDWFNYNAWDGGVDVHCEHWNYCFNQTCSNRGFCVNHPDGHTCDCDSGFTGTDCELQLCVGNVVCQNHGLCTPTGCECTSNYTGNDCSVYDRCGGIECGEGNCVIMPTVEEGCFADMLGEYLTNSVNTGYSLSASSEHSNSLMAQSARTDSGRSWSARSNNADQWLQVDFGNDIIAHSWYTLGRGDYSQWVTKYNFSYSLDGSEWRWFRDPRDILFGYRTFDGNTDQHTPVHYSFDEPTLLRYVRFHPVDWHGHISMRVEVEGCRHQPAGYECDCVTNVTGTWHHEVADDITTSCSVQACQHAFRDGSQVECRNFGECLDTPDVANSRFCNCSLGYTGPFCELDDLCLNPTDADNIPMENRACNDRGENCTLEIVGFATATGTYDSHEFTCDCFSPFSGPSCEVDDCNGTYTCENGGSCHPDYDGSCECVYPYEGEHCEEMDYCSGIDCQHGTCETNEAGDGFQCICNTHNGWVLNLDTGLCTTYYCADGNNFCMNEGFCREEYEYAEDGDPECLCTDWDRGTNCEDLNQCGPDNACNNRGLCNRNSGVCACSGNQYSGSACETEECRNGDFCYNGGSCRGNGNSCTCSYPYEGSPRCETANWCDGGVSCYEGECQSHDDGFLLPNLRQTGGFNCTCNPGYTHDTSGVTDYHLLNCTTEVCLDNNLCHNTGTCDARGDGTYRCRCSDGYTGDNCELLAEEESEEAGDDNTAAIAGGAAAGVAGLAATAGTIWGAARRCRRRPEEPEPRAEETDDCSIDDLEDGMGMAPNSMAAQGHGSGGLPF